MSKPIDQELLPCPFCGSKTFKRRSDDALYWTECQKCFATGPAHSRYDENNPWQSRAAVQTAGVAVPEADWVMHLLADCWPDSSERIEVELFAEWLREVLAAAPHPVSGEQHPDDVAVDLFAGVMKAKLAKSREKGRNGWQTASAALLGKLLYEHVYKGDPVDVANLAMMLHQNSQGIELPHDARRVPVSGEQKPAGYRIEASDQSGIVRRQRYSDRPFNSALDDALTWKSDFEVRSVPLYATPPAAQEVAGLVEALEHYAGCGKSGNVARVALAAHRARQGEKP